MNPDDNTLEMGIIMFILLIKIYAHCRKLYYTIMIITVIIVMVNIYYTLALYQAIK